MNSLKLALVASIAALSLAACSAADDSKTDETQPTAETSEDLSAKKCKGFLPAFCQVCSDGTSACAHWVVTKGKCTVETCKPPPACVQTQLCIIGDHFDTTQCKCVPDTTTCVQNKLCISGSHWSSVQCTCVSDSCVQNVLCVSTSHWDHTQCTCVPN